MDARIYDNLLSQVLSGYGLIHSYVDRSNNSHKSHVIVEPRTGFKGFLERQGLTTHKGKVLARIVEEPESIKDGHPHSSQLHYGQLEIEVVDRERMQDVLSSLQECFPDIIKVRKNGTPD